MLQLGWTVERYLREGDLVIFNRQPTLHKESIQAFRAYMHDDETFKLNLIDTTPFNADYDGDEMNMHVIGDVQAETEMQELLLVPHQIVSSQSNRPCMGLVHDGLVGFFMMTRRDEFFERNEVFRLVSRLKYAHKTLKRPRGVLQDYFNEQEAGFLDTLQLPPPAVLKPVPLWTGKQIASMLIPDLNWVGKIKPVPLHVLPEETDRRALVEEALSNSELDPLDL
jgi:DNA-directed RNA polymerase II subunit RPB1